jgi:hypothetical protein
MEYYLRIDTDFTISFKPTHFFFRVVNSSPNGVISAYWKVVCSNVREDGTVGSVSQIMEGNQDLPSVVLTQLLVGDFISLNHVLSHFAWGGPLTGFQLKVDKLVTEDEVYRGIKIELENGNNEG